MASRAERRAATLKDLANKLHAATARPEPGFLEAVVDLYGDPPIPEPSSEHRRPSAEELAALSVIAFDPHFSHNQSPGLLRGVEYLRSWVRFQQRRDRTT